MPETAKNNISKFPPTKDDKIPKETEDAKQARRTKKEHLATMRHQPSFAMYLKQRNA